ncbi:cytochrome c oxidase subunit I [Massilia sp. H6]|uniref:cytochrome c oxidase subunit I n=1 Tax=Massilia sp. H6 TaxID=2970464 RepID=UPI0021695321|nr:cytochrome c oxidase subunit I [Massilia sp. H6]UVW30501.1 cytochrome c oxidase subunit I [Massilia sp. H6]
MTLPASPSPAASGPAPHLARLQAIWENPSGLGMLTVVNHTTIGLRFIITGFIFFLIGGILAMWIRSQLAFPGNELLDHKTYAEAFTMHGTTMMFFFAVPMMEGIAVYLLPKMIGTRDLIYPRLSAFGYWCYLFGGILLYSSFLFDAVPDGGWFMYVPLNSAQFSAGSNVDFWLLGVTFAEISAVAAGVELIVAILKTRTSGMAIHRMPLYAWYILVMAFMIVFGFPPLILASILLEIERAFGLPFYDTALGGNPLLWQHLFWIFGHPEVYIIFLPAAGLVTTILPTFARRPMVGYNWVVMAVIATGFISFGLWVHHMFAVGIPLLSLAFFSAASMAVAIPTAIQVFAWIATLWSGKPVISTPMLYILGFLFIFVLGGLTGVMVALVPFDWQVHDTHFVVAHLHYVLFGGMVFPMFAAFYYWLPLLSGREPSLRLSRVAFWTIFIGFNITFLPMHLTGLLGMPRRVYTYLPELGWGPLNLISTVGGFISAIGVAILMIDVITHFIAGKRARPNVWNAGTLEWATPTPVPAYNFASQAHVDDREPLWKNPALAQEIQEGRHLLGHADPSRREILMTSITHAKPQAVAILPGNTIVPLIAAGLTSVFFIGFLAKLYWLAAIGAAATLGALLVWAWQNGSRQELGDVDEGRHGLLPVHYRLSLTPGWWGTLFALLADGTLFISLIFAYFFLWTVSAQWPPAAYREIGLGLPSAAFAVLLLAGLAACLAEASVREARSGRAQVLYATAAISGVLFVVLQVWTLQGSGLSAKAHAYGALVHTISGFQFVHVVIAVVMALFALLRVRHGYLHPTRPGEGKVVSLFWKYTMLQWLLGFATIHVFPLVVGAG